MWFEIFMSLHAYLHKIVCNPDSNLLIQYKHDRNNKEAVKCPPCDSGKPSVQRIHYLDVYNTIRKLNTSLLGSQKETNQQQAIKIRNLNLQKQYFDSFSALQVENFRNNRYHFINFYQYLVCILLLFKYCFVAIKHKSSWEKNLMKKKHQKVVFFWNVKK